MKAATVTGVYTVTDALSDNYGQQLVNTDAGGGPDGTPGVVNALPGYYPQRGDRVIIDDLGGGVWVVTGCLTPNRGPVIPRVPTVTMANAGPSGWTQVAQFFADPATNSNPDMVAVPSTVIIPPPPATPTTLVMPAASGHSWRADFGGSWSDLNGRIYQGSYGGYGPWQGLWFYPSMTAALSGHTVTGIRIHVHRSGSGGNWGPVQLHFYLHNHASQPAGAPTLFGGPVDITAAAPSLNDAIDIALPLAWAQAIQAGTAAGVGIGADDQDSYSILFGPDEDASSGQLSIDYT